MPEFFDVKFAGEAAEQMSRILREDCDPPIMVPADELILKMEVGPCARCGKMPAEGELAACDPIGVTNEGVLVGETICHLCLKLEVEGDG